MDATEAERWGLVNRVVEPNAVTETAVELGYRVCAGAPLAIAAVKEVARETESLSVSAGYARMRGGELPQYSAMLTSADAEEGPSAFTEKREPQWIGR